MSWYEWMYYTSFLVGFVYAIVTFLLGHIGGEVAGDGDVDVGGGHDVGRHRAVTQDRQLAEDRAAAHPAQRQAAVLGALDANLDLTVEHHPQRLAGLAPTHDGRTLFEVDL